MAAAVDSRRPGAASADYCDAGKNLEEVHHVLRCI